MTKPQPDTTRYRIIDQGQPWHGIEFDAPDELWEDQLFGAAIHAFCDQYLSQRPFQIVEVEEPDGA